MSTKTGIEWTDATWNPIRGCSRVSKGCEHCYAESVAYRFSGTGQPYEGLVTIGADGARRRQWNGEIKFVEEHLLDPLKWGPVWEACAECKQLVAANPDLKTDNRCISRARRIFVNSMSDLFHENVTDEMRDRIFAVMALCPQHTFQVLTKRPERMLEYVTSHGRTTEVYNQAACIIDGNWSRMSKQMAHHRSSGEGWWPLPNVWLGVSAESQDVLNKRVWPLLKTPAVVRFISAEPLLGPLDLNAGELLIDRRRFTLTLGRYLDWVIVGGESGPGARPMHPDWVRSLRDQCVAAGVPLFFKQWGEWIDGRNMNDCDAALFRCSNPAKNHQWGNSMPWSYRVGKKAAGHLLDGKEWHQFPEVR